MIKQIFCLTLSLTLATSPLLGTRLVHQNKPTTILSKKGYTIARVTCLATLASFLYLIKPSQIQKKRTAQSRIFYTYATRPNKHALILLYYSVLASTLVALFGFVDKLDLNSWNNRSNQEVYDDAFATYANIFTQMTSTNYFAKDPLEAYTTIHHFLTQNPRQAKRIMNELSNLYQDSSYKKYLLSEKKAILADHYDALKERLERDTNIANVHQWNELAEKMDNELKKLQSFIDLFSETTENQ